MEIESANKQHPIPQNVMDVEFKLIGELTIRQFSYLLVFGFLMLLTYNTLLPAVFKYTILLAELLAGLGFAFWPVNDIPLDKWVVNYIAAIKNPRVRVWKHTKTLPYYFTLKPQKTKTKKTQVNKTLKRSSVDDLLKKRGSKDTDFQDEEDLIKKEKDFYKKIGFGKDQKGEDKDKQDKEKEEELRKEVLKDEQEAKQKFSSIAISKSTNTKVKDTKPEEPKKEEKWTKEKKEDYSKHIEELSKLKQKLLKELDKNKYKVMEGKEEDIEELKRQEEQKEKLNSQQEKKGLKEKLEGLQKKGKEEEKAPHAQELEPEKAKSSIFTGFLEKLQNTSSSKKKEEKQEIVKEQKEKPEKSIEIKEPKQKKPDMLEKARKEKEDDMPRTIDAPAEPNTIYGRVEDNQNNLISDCIVIIKDKDEEPVRALKTNKLGQFQTATRVENGSYKIEGIKEGYEFEPKQLEASGELLNPVKLIGRRK